jgi:hypothetical protein
LTCEQAERKYSLLTELSQLKSLSSEFQKTLLLLCFSDDYSPVYPPELLLEPENGLFSSFIGSVLGTANIATHTPNMPFLFTIDSGSTVHVLTLKAALDLLSAQRPSDLKIVGVSGACTRADLMGHLVICVRDAVGKEYVIDLGVAHGMRDCPLNILSVSLLMKAGAVMHFEEGNCYIRPFKEASKIHFVDLGSGLFQLRGENALTLPGSFSETGPKPNSEGDAKHTFSVNG